MPTIKCEECDKRRKVYPGLNNELFCAECLEAAEYEICPECGEVYYSDDLIEHPNGIKMCENCLYEQCILCDNCGNFYRSTIYESFCVTNFRGFTDTICQECARDVEECSNCMEFYWRCDMVSTQEGLVCNRCYQRDFFTCASCAGIFHSDYGFNGICEDCNDLEYDDNFTPNGFRDRTKISKKIGSKRHYGLELETDRCNEYQSLNSHPAWGAKNDPSIAGKEFYSAILSGDAGLKAIREWADMAKRNNWFAGRNAGYHLHLDMRDTNTDALYAIAYAYRKTEEVWFSFVENERSCGIYSHEICWDCSDIINSVEKSAFRTFQMNRSRYEWCNITAWRELGTFEIRLHQGTCDEHEIINWVKAHIRFVDWAEKLGFAGVRKALDGLRNLDMFALIVNEVWKDKNLTEYYSEKIRYYRNGFLSK